MSVNTQGKIAVLDDYDGSISRLPCWDKLRSDFKIDFFSTPQSASALTTYEVIVTVRERTIVTKEFLAATPSLKHLAVTGRLSGQADLEELKRRGISASFTEGSGQAAAELTIALLLGAMKGIHLRHSLVQRGGWQEGLGTSLSCKTLGVLGLGRVGQKVAQFGKLMGMRVLSWGPTAVHGRSEKLGVERLELPQVLSQSDAICVCLRLSDKTRNLLGSKELALLKDGTSLINTARAEIIERSALYSELESGRIQGAFDVFHAEPLPENDAIRQMRNVLLSPHMGYVTKEVYDIFFQQVAYNILKWKKGEPYKDALLS